MSKKATYYHAGCPVCVDAERSVLEALDRERFEIERVHLGEESARIAEAEKAGVRSVPALVLDGAPFHINHGADLADLQR